MEAKLRPVIVTLSSYARGERGEKEQPIRLMCHGRLRSTCALPHTIGQRLKRYQPKLKKKIGHRKLTISW